MAADRGVITLTTDFGTSDHFAGVMKGVILGIHPGAAIVDITHEVPAQDVAAAAFQLSNAWPHFPSGTVHVAVVDPGVGSSRRVIALSAGEHLFLAPDNGLLTPVFRAAADPRTFAVTDRRYMAPSLSHTFHGRDIFAPAAAHLARGTKIENLGEEISDPVLHSAEPPLIQGSTIRARVMHVDRFGNLVLNVDRALLERAAGGIEVSTVSAQLGGRRIDRFVTHYAAAGEAPCFLINSDGRLELALPGGSAAAAFGLSRGSEVVFRLDGPPE